MVELYNKHRVVIVLSLRMGLTKRPDNDVFSNAVGIALITMLEGYRFVVPALFPNAIEYTP